MTHTPSQMRKEIDETPAAVIQCGAHASNRVLHIVRRAKGQHPLPIDFAPEGDLAFEFTPDFLNVHTEEL